MRPSYKQLFGWSGEERYIGFTVVVTIKKYVDKYNLTPNMRTQSSKNTITLMRTIYVY